MSGLVSTILLCSGSLNLRLCIPNCTGYKVKRSEIKKIKSILGVGKTLLKVDERFFMNSTIDQVESYKEEISSSIHDAKKYKNSGRFRTISKAHQNELILLLKDLAKAETRVINYLFHLKRGGDFVTAVEMLDLPVYSVEREAIDTSQVDTSRMFFPKDFIKDLSLLDPPTRRKVR